MLIRVVHCVRVGVRSPGDTIGSRSSTRTAAKGVTGLRFRLKSLRLRPNRNETHKCVAIVVTTERGSLKMNVKHRDFAPAMELITVSPVQLQNYLC